MDSTKQKKDKKIIAAIATLVVGLITLVVGVVFLVLHLTGAPAVQDAEYLVKIGSWAEADEPGVIWTFTEVGKGTLTTNNHENDYDFIWAIEDGRLLIETDWLYTLNDTYEYELNQGEQVLTLRDTDGESGSGSGDIKFRPAGSVDTEVTEGN